MCSLWTAILTSLHKQWAAHVKPTFHFRMGDVCVLDFWPHHSGLLLVLGLHEEVYLQNVKCVSLWLHNFCLEREGWVCKLLNHTNWMTVVTSTDQPQLARNHYVIEIWWRFVILFPLGCWGISTLRTYKIYKDKVYFSVLTLQDYQTCHHIQSLFEFQLLGECHCWWTKESTRAHVAKFYGRLRLICSVWEHQNFRV